MKLSKEQDCLSPIMQGVIPEDIHNATFGRFATIYPIGISGNFHLFHILYITCNLINAFLSN